MSFLKIVINISFISFLIFIFLQISNFKTFSGIVVNPDPLFECVLPLNNINSKILTNSEL